MRLKAFFHQFQTLILVVCVMAFSIGFAPVIPLTVKVYAYTVSHVMRECLLFALPFLIIPFMVTSMASLKVHGAFLVVSIMVLMTLSNFMAIMVAYGMGKSLIPLMAVKHVTSLAITDELTPLIQFTLTPLMRMEVALALAFVIGVGLSMRPRVPLLRFFEGYAALAMAFFEKVFIPLLPIYICGTILKITYETDLTKLLPIFGGMTAAIFMTQVAYISLLFWIGSGLNLKGAIRALRNAIPAGIVGFSSMSSMVTMPVTLKAAQKNIPDANLARVSIATTVNTHIVGESISLPMIALTIYFITFDAFPSLHVYLPFALLLTLAQFSAVAVPGGSIVVMLPFLAQYLAFSDEMTSLIMALSIFLDPLGTSQNVMGNSAFAMVIYRLHTFLVRWRWRG
jgi:Na+/H+-dicarboxylate symporter